MSLDAGAAPDRVSLSESKLRPALRKIGMGVTIIGGPAAMALAVFGFNMGLVEGAAVLILLSGWLGPRLMRVRA